MKTIPQHTLDYIDSWLDLRSKWEDYPGFVVAITQNGKTVFNKAYGYADLESKVKMTTDHVFRIASHSKTFTATAIMQLQEQGKLRIDDLAVNYLPWLKEHTDNRWNEVTIRQLLSHSAGVIRDGKDSDYWQLYKNFPDSDELKQAILETNLVIEPNTKLKYSNYGYSLIGEIIEKVSGLSYSDYVQKYIIRPLDLKNTYADQTDDVKAKLARGYSRPTLKKERLPLLSVPANSMASATGFCSTSADLAKYFSAQLIGTGKLVSDASKKEMQREHWRAKGTDDAYGLGFDIQESGKRKLVGHSGGFPGFSTRSFMDQSDKIVISVLVNTSSMVNTIAKTLYMLIDEFGDKPPKSELLQYEGRFSNLLGVMDVIAHSGGVRAIYPNSWFPLDVVDKLEVVDENTLRIEECGSFDSAGELLLYKRERSGKIIRLIDSGGVRLPSKDGDLPITWK